MDYTQITHLLKEPVIAALAGTVLGVLLKVAYDWLREKKQLANFRAILALEMQSNLELVEPYWEEVMGDRTARDENNSQRCSRFYRSPFPAFQETAFQAHMLLLSASLSHERVKAVLQFYGKLCKLRALKDKNLEECRQHPLGKFSPCDEYLREADSLIDGLRKSGNPLTK
ncbi:hypothetical protein H0O01_02190 [Candidatus Micrarchaeota archaeon]|nr:hypothetical protein [Candidatus Micrarchaeota archaeon]